MPTVPLIANPENPSASHRVNDVMGAISTQDQKDAGTRLSDDALSPMSCLRRYGMLSAHLAE